MRYCIRHFLEFLLATLIAAAPLLPAFAFDGHAHGGSAQAATASLADLHGTEAHHAPDFQVKSSSCDKHDDCQGQCCAVCAHCFTVSVPIMPALGPAHPVQTATVRELHDSLLVTFLNRPPQRG